MTPNDHTNTILVLGGSSSKTGRRVAARLQARNIPFRFGSRSSAIPFDWEDPTTWRAALDGVGAAYVTYQPDLGVPQAVAAIHNFTALAVQSGVARIVLLSGRGEEEAQRCEQIVQDSGAQWTIVRASWFMQNFSESFMHDLVMSGEVALPVANVAEPFVDTEDIADVVVAALTEDRHTGQVYEVTGPRCLTFAQTVAEIAAATGRDLSFVALDQATFEAGMQAADVDADTIALMTYLFTTVLDGRNAHLADGVQRALGRPPREFTDYVRDTAAQGIWNA